MLIVNMSELKILVNDEFFFSIPFCRFCNPLSVCVRWLYFIWQQSICMIVFYILDFIKLFTWNDKMNEEERKWVSEQTSKYLSSTFICLLHTLWKSVPYTYTFRKMPKTPPHIVSAFFKYSHFFLLFCVFWACPLNQALKKNAIVIWVSYSKK